MPFLGPLFEPYAAHVRRMRQPLVAPADALFNAPPERAGPADGPNGNSGGMPGLLGSLENGMTSPLFLAGLGLMGDGPHGMMVGLKTGSEIRKGQQTLPLERRIKEAELDFTRARTGYYNRGAGGTGGAGTGSSATERIIERLMSEDPNLSYGDAITRARRAPQDDAISRERLAVQASRADPSRSLEEWRSYYGLQTAAPPPGQEPPSAPTFGRSGTRENPITPRSQADIDAAPPGTVFSVNGQLMVK